MRRSIIAVAIFLLPFTVQAQVRGGGGGGARGAGGAGGGHAMISAPRAAAPSFSRVGGGGAGYGSASARSSSRAGMQRSPVYRGTRVASSRPNSQRGFVPDFTGVPGLGFDWVHYGATHPGNGRGDGRYGGRNGRGNFGNRFQGYFPFFDSGFLLPYADSYDYADGPAQTAAYYDESPAPPDQGSNYVEQADPRPYAPPRTASAYDVVVKPPNPNDAYIFVKRDGSVFLPSRIRGTPARSLT